MDDETRAYFEAMRRDFGARFDAIDQQFGIIDERLGAIDQRFGIIDARFGTIDQRFSAIDARFGTIDQRFGAIDQRFEALDRKIDTQAAETRRHFDVVADDMRRLVAQVAEGVRLNDESLNRLRIEIRAGFESRDVVLRAAFADVRRDIDDLRRRL